MFKREEEEEEEEDDDDHHHHYHKFHTCVFLCKYIALGSKQFKGLLHPHDRPQHLILGKEFCRVFVTFQYITQTLCTVLFFNHYFTSDI